MFDVVYIPEPPPSACGNVVDDGIYVRGIGGGGWGGGEGGSAHLITPLWPPRGDNSGIVTSTPRTTPRVVVADAVLAGLPEEQWLAASSQQHYWKREWAAQTAYWAGMTLRRRLNNGILLGVTDQDEALQRLLALAPQGSDWQQVGGLLNGISHVTKAMTGNVHSLVMDAYLAWKENKPWRVLALTHMLLDKRRPKDIRSDLLNLLGLIAPDDMYWRRNEENNA